MPRFDPQGFAGPPRMAGVALFRRFERFRGAGMHLRFWHVAVLLALVFLALSAVGDKAAPKD
jgi:hypothetical protein